MTTITRNQLQSLLPVSDCEDWTQAINTLLESSIEDLIEVSENYITDLNNQGTWKEIHKVLELGILNIQYPPEALDFVRKLLTVGTKQVDNNWFLDDTWYFELDEKNKCFWFSTNSVYLDLVEKYACNRLQISKLMTDVLNDVVKLEGFTPFSWKFNGFGS